MSKRPVYLNDETEIRYSRRKAKPLFDEERNLIEEKLPELKPLPNDMWIVGGTVKYLYRDLYCKDYYVKFRCDEYGNFSIIKDNSKMQSDKAHFDNEDTHFYTINETIESERERVLQHYEKCLDRIVEYVKSNPTKPYKISLSGGKDSECIYTLWEEVLTRLDFKPDYEYIFFNTTNEVADVYLRIKQIPNIHIINPTVGWKQWIVDKNYFFPSQNARSCCSTYKEGQSKKAFDNSAPIVQVLGVRKHESNKRSQYDFLMDNDFDIKLFGSAIMPKPWVKLAPIVDFETIDIWLLMFMKNMYINRRYKLGCMRVGCLICPFSGNYEDMLIRKYYPKQWEWFVKAISKNYEINKNRKLGFALDEFIHGHWKGGNTKYNNLIHSKATPEKIHQFASVKGLSDEMAAKYFNRICKSCNCNLSV